MRIEKISSFFDLYPAALLQEFFQNFDLDFFFFDVIF